jgi:hypothetical protein
VRTSRSLTGVRLLAGAVAAALALGASLLGTAAASAAPSHRPQVTQTSPHMLRLVPTLSPTPPPPLKGIPHSTGLICRPKGESDRTCLMLIGKDLYLEDWYENWGRIEPGECTFGTFYGPPTHILYTTEEACNKTGSAVYASVTWPINYTFPAPIILCNTGLHAPGKPCAGVEK